MDYQGNNALTPLRCNSAPKINGVSDRFGKSVYLCSAQGTTPNTFKLYSHHQCRVEGTNPKDRNHVEPSVVTLSGGECQCMYNYGNYILSIRVD